MDLDVMLVEREDPDWQQASRLLPLAPAERWAHSDDVARQMHELRKAGRHGA